jgi:lipopolysaccharide kinase (Kdo/WaaP) family protein
MSARLRWDVHPDLAPRLREAGIATPLAALELLGATSVRRLRDRENLYLSFPGSPPLVVYGKRHRSPGIRGFLADLVRLRPPASPARREWDATAAVRALGIATPEPVLLVEEEGLVPGRSLFASAGLVDARPLDDVLPEVDFRTRRAIARAAAGLVRRLHDADLFHRDLYLCHLYLDRRGALSLIDLHRVRAGAAARDRWAVKDLAALLSSCPKARVTRTDALRFLRAYLDARPFDAPAKRLVRRVVRKAERIARHTPKNERRPAR